MTLAPDRFRLIQAPLPDAVAAFERLADAVQAAFDAYLQAFGLLILRNVEPGVMKTPGSWTTQAAHGSNGECATAAWCSHLVTMVLQARRVRGRDPALLSGQLAIVTPPVTPASLFVTYITNNPLISLVGAA